MARTKTVTVSEFKASCIDLLDELSSRRTDKVTITRRGTPIGVLTPPEEEKPLRAIHGFMKGSVTIPEGFDLTKPILEDDIFADSGRIHE